MHDENAHAAYLPDPAALRRSFDRAATSYDGAALLQAEIREELLRRLDFVALDPRVIIDAGAGTGHASRALRRRYPRARIIALDFAPGMLRAAGRQQSWRRRFDRIRAELTALPLGDASVDLIFCNLTLPWCEPDAFFAEMRRIIAPGGHFTLTSLGPDSLHELRAAWSGLDAHVHVNRFIDMHDLGDGLVRAGFADPVLDVERRLVTYADVSRLMQDLRACGERNVLRGRPKGLTGRSRMQAMRDAYERFRHDGRLPASFEVVFAQAWAPVPRPAVRTPDGDTLIEFEAFKRQLRRGRPA